MSNISGLRDAADILLQQKKYKEAYDIYDEVYNQLWCAIGYTQTGVSEFSFGYLMHNLKAAVDFRGNILQPALNTTFLKWFELDLDQTLNEFIFCSYGHLKCIALSKQLISKNEYLSIISEFLVLYNLIIYSTDDSWGQRISKIMTPVVDGIKLKRLRPNIPEQTIKKLLVESAGKIISTDWESLNHVFLDYLEAASEEHTLLYESVLKLTPGRSKTHSHYSHYNWQKQDKRERSGTYEKYEKYERYEKYEKYEQSKYESSDEKSRNEQNEKGSGKKSGYNTGKNEYNNAYSQGSNSGPKSNSAHNKKSSSHFDLSTATDEQKARYYGKILGLEGRVTRADIRKKYLETISKYHPDLVQNLGEDILEIAERKTKEINAAYDWFRAKFNIQ